MSVKKMLMISSITVLHLRGVVTSFPRVVGPMRLSGNTYDGAAIADRLRPATAMCGA